MQKTIMNQSQIKLANILTYSGTLPLVVSAIALCVPLVALNGVLIFFAKTYGAIIISFLCGIHWAAYLFSAEKCPRNLLMTSNAIALLAWVSLLITHPSMAIALQIVCFLYLIAIDLNLRNSDILPQWFYRLRQNATVIVVLCLATIAWLS